MSDWQHNTPWRLKRVEQNQVMDQIVEIVKRYEAAAISAPRAIGKVRELLEPRIVKVGDTHTPEVQS